MAILAGLPMSVRGDRPTIDHLVPLKDRHGVLAEYEQAWRQVLLVTPAEVARFVSVPGSANVETVVSVYRAQGKKGLYRGTTG